VRLHRGVVVGLSGLALCAWCGWVSGFHRSTASGSITWAISLAAVVVVDFLFWQGRRGRHPGLRLKPQAEPGVSDGDGALVPVSPWLGLVLVVITWEILGLSTGKHQPHLTISALTQVLRPLNAAILLGWMLVGMGYGAARARAPLVGGSACGKERGPEGSPAQASVAVPRLPAATPALLLPSSRAVGVGFWMAVIAAGVIIDLTARRSSGRVATAEELIRFVTAPRVANVALIVAWTYAGYHLFAR
jgi:hypothetical protein